MMAPEDGTQKLGVWRTLGTIVGVGLVAGSAPLSVDGFDLWDFLTNAPLVLVAAYMVFLLTPFIGRMQHMAAQMFARAVWWQTFVFACILGGAILHFGEANSEPWMVFGLAFAGSALCLVSAGRVGVDRQSAVFAPVAFRAALFASIVLAMADAQTLILYSGLAAEGIYEHRSMWDPVDLLEFAVASAVMVTALVGMYRLKVWAVVLNVCANLAIAVYALSGGFELPEGLAYGLAATAFLQLLVPIPMIRAMFRGARR